MGERNKQDSEAVPVQKAKKKRSQAAKRGINRWNQVLLKRSNKKLDRILDELRWVRSHLQAQGHSDYTKPMIERIAAKDQVDLDIIERVLQAGVQGVFPKDVAKDLNAFKRYGLRYYDVSRRIVRMNNRLHYEAREYLFEKRGHRWALTSFGFDGWGRTTEEVEVEGEVSAE